MNTMIVKKGMKKIIIFIFLSVIASSSDIKGNYEKAINFLYNGKVSESEKLAEEISKSTNKKDTEYAMKINYKIGYFYLHSEQNLEKSEKYYAKALEIDNGRSKEVLEMLSDLVNIYVINKKYKEAEETLIKLNNITNGKNQERLGLFYMRVLKNYDKAQEAFDKLPKRLEYKLCFLELYENKLDEDKLKELITEMENKNQINNFNMAMYYYFGEFPEEQISFYGVINSKLVERYLKKSIEEDKNNDALLYLGQYYYYQNRKEEAEKIIKKAKDLGVDGAEKLLKTTEEN